MQHFTFFTGNQNLLWALKSKDVGVQVATMSKTLILAPEMICIQKSIR